MEKEFISILLDFVEGKMTAEKFWNHYQNDEELRKSIIKDLDKNKLPDAYFDPIEFLNKNINLSSYGDSLELQGVAEIILEDNNISCTPTNFYSERYDFLLDMQPDWLDITVSNEKFLIDLANSAPKDLNESQRIKWCQDKLKELFKYDSRPPRWIQSPEWPIIKGKPLVFKGQSKERAESELVKFFFYNPETGEETVVEQYY